MCLRSVKPRETPPGTCPGRGEGQAGRARVWSITRRFTVLYVASTAVLLLLAAGFLDWALARSLDARDHALVMSKAQVVRLLLREQPHATEVLASEVAHEAEGPLRYFLRVLDREERVIVETPGMGRWFPVDRFPPAAESLPEPPEEHGVNLRHVEGFLMLAVWADVGVDGLDRRQVQVALDVSPDLAFMAGYRKRLLMVLGAGLLFAAGVGGWLARQGVQPLHEITRSVRQITGSHLRERIVVSRWPAELAELGTALNAMLDRLEDAFNRLSHGAADLAHELRTPINNLRGEAEVALARGRTSAEYQSVLASSLEEFERLSRMIDGLLFIARADDPRAVVECVALETRRELEAVREFYDALAAERGVEVTCGGEGWVRADPMLFRRAVGNLLANALRHTAQGGRVWLEAKPGGEGRLAVEVRDTGSGIAVDDVPRVFDRFYRADRSRSGVGSGTGLGLPIVQSIMRLHGGEVELRSALGRGTTVTLRFAAAAAPRQMTEM